MTSSIQSRYPVLNAKLPLVSIVIPARNEAKYIADCLFSFAKQDYPRERLEVIVADGVSDDTTKEVIATFAALHPSLTLRVIDNPDRLTPHALNLGIKNSTGDIIIIFGAHSLAATNYVRLVVETLEVTGAGAAGGRLEEVGANFLGVVIGAARNSLIGGAISPHRFSSKPGFVDTVRFAGYRREVFEKVGLFDQELVRNQDDEFNYRVRFGGYGLYFNPEIAATYYARGSFSKLWKQMYGYGYWKPRVIQKNPAAFSLQFAVPPAMILSLIAFAIGSFLLDWAKWLLIVEVISYSLLIFSFATGVSWRRGWNFWPGVLLAYVVIHFGIGLGTLAGLGRLWMRRRPVTKLA